MMLFLKFLIIFTNVLGIVQVQGNTEEEVVVTYKPLSDCSVTNGTGTAYKVAHSHFKSYMMYLAECVATEMSNPLHHERELLHEQVSALNEIPSFVNDHNNKYDEDDDNNHRRLCPSTCVAPCRAGGTTSYVGFRPQWCFQHCGSCNRRGRGRDRRQYLRKLSDVFVSTRASGISSFQSEMTNLGLRNEAFLYDYKACACLALTNKGLLNITTPSDITFNITIANQICACDNTNTYIYEITQSEIYRTSDEDHY